MKKQLRVFILSFTLIGLAAVSQAQEPCVNYGRLFQITLFQSAYVTPRNIDIWVPDNYSDSSSYPVLYMHDGQYIFNSTENIEHYWNMDSVIHSMVSNDRIEPLIIVAIWSDVKHRFEDYFPEDALNHLTRGKKWRARTLIKRDLEFRNQVSLNANNYLKFITRELKPHIDSTLNTKPDAEHTILAGSSMGGLISWYGFCKYPDIFGKAACFSPHWTGTLSTKKNPISNAFLYYLSNNLPAPSLKNRIYFDTGDQQLDANYPSIQRQVDEVMQSKGYSSNSWKTMYFINEGHKAFYWKHRSDDALEFLLSD